MSEVRRPDLLSDVQRLFASLIALIKDYAVSTLLTPRK